ncbi:cupin domain-containing protein [Rhizobium sp. Rhizsp82]|uniref:AraC family transcriptional regulator n=1 Tax=Rhizobium sp. Rhizsp82 TaxID=3243057 RepID=UPI0039B4BA95
MVLYSGENGLIDQSSKEVGPVDLLSDVLRFVQLTGGTVLAGDLPPESEQARLKNAPAIHVIQDGAVDIVRPSRVPLRVEQGEIVLVPRAGLEHVIRASARPENIRPRLISATFDFDNAEAAAPLLRLLPDLIHITPAMDNSSVLIKDVAQFLVLETVKPEPGFALMISRVIDILVIRCIRTWSRTVQNDGWVGSLADDRISRVVATLHRHPADPWTVALLAALAGMSRSSFADRFAQLVGVPPLRYLQNWRLSLATELLQNSQISVKEIAFLIGYESEAAFSRAYRSKFGYPPGGARQRVTTTVSQIS